MTNGIIGEPPPLNTAKDVAARASAIGHVIANLDPKKRINLQVQVVQEIYDMIRILALAIK